MRYELKIALRYLRARRKEAFISVTTVFTAVGVMIGVAALTITLAIMGGFQESLKEQVLSLSPQIEVRSSEGSIARYAGVEAAAASIAGVAGADAFMVGQAMLSSGRGIGGVIVRGIKPQNPVVIEEWGRYMRRGGLDRLGRDYSIPNPAGGREISVGAIAIGIGLAEKLKAKLGDPVRVVAPIVVPPSNSLTTMTGAFVVGAIFESGLRFADRNLVFIDLQRAQKFFGRPDRADGIDVHLVHLDDTVRVTAALKKLLGPPYIVSNWIEQNESASAGFEILKRIDAIVLVLLIGVAAFNLVATLIMIVMEKRKDIAVLIAMGATRRDVRLIFVFKGMIVGAAGTLAGLSLGAAGCFALARYHFIHIPKEVYGISTLPIAVQPSNFALVALASLLLCLIATFYPAEQASREMPVEVFRS